jgi:predicted ArsR family transcriptional regulator
MQRSRGPVDEVDREIIRLLQRDGRTSNTDIARALEVTETTIRKRIARLIEGARGRDQPDPQGGQVLLRVGDPLGVC